MAKSAAILSSRSSPDINLGNNVSRRRASVFNSDFLKQIYEVMRDSGLREFADFTDLIAQKHPDLLLYVFEKSYFFKIYLDSKRYNIRESKENEEEINGK